MLDHWSLFLPEATSDKIVTGYTDLLRDQLADLRAIDADPSEISAVSDEIEYELEGYLARNWTEDQMREAKVAFRAANFSTSI